MEFNFMLQIIADIDEVTKEVTVKKVIPINTAPKSESIEHTITKGQAQYGILTLGKNARSIGMTVGTEIAMEIDGNLLEKRFTTHKTVTGRIDGLTSLYTEGLLKGEETIQVQYNAGNRLLKIQHISK